MKQLLVMALVMMVTGMHQQCFAQQGSRDSAVTAAKDSAAITDSIMKDFKELLDELVAPKSFFTIGSGLGNRTFSVKNNSLNAQEATTDILSVTPFAGYYHKSGLGLTIMGYASAFPDNNIGFYQYAFTPTYDYASHRLAAGVSYTRYFGKDTGMQNTSPYSNDVYAYVNLIRKSWRYGVTLGYATGTFSDKLTYRDSVQRFSTILQRLQWVKENTTVKSTSRIRDFSLSANVRKDFQWDDVLKKGDNIIFSVVGYLVGGSSQMHTTANTNVNLKVQKITLQRFKRSYKNEDGNDFQLQSTALSFSVYYAIGKFNIQPVWFMDYYFPDTSKKYSQVFSLSAGFNF